MMKFDVYEKRGRFKVGVVEAADIDKGLQAAKKLTNHPMISNEEHLSEMWRLDHMLADRLKMPHSK